MNTIDIDDVTNIPVLHHIPQRHGPALRDVVAHEVSRPDQLPPYLMLGERDDSSFRCSQEGWSIDWRGREPDTCLTWEYRHSNDTSVVSQRWRGIDGGVATCRAGMPMAQVVGGLYLPFPVAWDRAAHSLHESNFRLLYLEEPEQAETLCGIPDGAFRTVVVPLCANQVGGFAARWRAWAVRPRLPFPVTTHLTRIRCDAAYLHGHHGVGGETAAWLMDRCERQTGVRPACPPERVYALGDHPAWEIERSVPCAVITAPFAGLSETVLGLEDLGLLTPSGEPFRLRDDRPDGAEPLILPTALCAGAILTVWPDDRSMGLRWTLQNLLPSADEVGGPKARSAETLH